MFKKSNKKLNKKEIKSTKTETKEKFKEQNKKILNMTGKRKIFSLNFFRISDCRKIYGIETTVKYLQHIRKVNIRYKLKNSIQKKLMHERAKKNCKH